MGIWCVPTLNPIIDISSLATASVILLCALIGIFFLQHKNCHVLLLLPCFTLLTGYLHGLAHFQAPVSREHIYNSVSSSTEVVLTGSLEEMVTYNGKMSKALIELDSILPKEKNFHKPVHGLVRLSYMGEWPATILPGDQIIVRADIKRPHSFHTPGVFDYSRFLAQKDIWMTGYIRSPLFIHELTREQSDTGQYKYLPEILRTHIGNFLDKSLDPKFSSIYRALLLGDRSRVSPAVLELFKASGTFHILAISGLHIAVIATLLYFIFYWTLSRSEYLLLNFQIRKTVAILTIPVLVGYALLAGMNSPVTRAVIMSSILLIALCTDRKKSPSPLVAAAALIILIFDPLQLFTVSFQLSFAAIIGIIFIFPALQKQILAQQTVDNPQKPFTLFCNYVFSAFMVSVVATLATAPITISTFNRISTIGPIANLIIEPLICLCCLPAGLLALPFIWLQPEIAHFLLHLGTYGISSALYVAEVLTNYSFSSIYLPRPGIYDILLYLMCIYLCVQGYILKSKKQVLIFIPALFMMFLAIHYLPSTEKTGAKVSFIDVGQGSATLIETGKSAILIDGGGSSFSTRSVGETVIAPFLWSKRIKSLDTVIITHPDADHYNGLGYILKHFSPKRIWVRDFSGHDQNYINFINLAQEKAELVTIPHPGDEIREGDMTLECLANLKGQHFQNTRSGHSANTGLILKSCFKEHCFLFPGDINTSMEGFLLEQHIDLKANTLLSAHHGSKTSNSKAFLTAVSPQQTIVSAGQSNKGYFPHQSFLELCNELNIEVLKTSSHGSIEFVVKNTKTTINIAQRFQDNPLYPIMFVPKDEYLKKKTTQSRNRKISPIPAFTTETILTIKLL